MEYEFDEVRLKQQLKKMPFWKQLAFLLVVRQRLLPSFRVFSMRTGCEGLTELDQLLAKSWDSLLEGISNANYIAEASLADSLAPDTEQYDMVLVSSALDAAASISLLMEAFGNQKTETVVEAVTLARDSIDMYVQELEGLDPCDPLLERKILRHDLMQRELAKQDAELHYLDTLDNDVRVSMSQVKSRWFDRKDSCLDL